MADPAAPVARSTTRGRRVLGGLGIAVVSTLVAAIAHSTAGAAWPSLVVLGVAVLASLFVTLPVVGARVRSWRIALAVVLDQFVFHVLFATLGSAGSAVSAPADGGAHAQHAIAPIAVGEAAAASAEVAMAEHHALAATVSFALLRGGWQLVLHAVAAGAGFVLAPFRPHAVASTPAARRIRPAVLRVDRPVAARLSPSIRRRGPPVVASLA